jgi:SAM-dependent methyltransferase
MGAVRYGRFQDFEGFLGAEAAVRDLIEKHGARHVLEIGSGANPTLAVDYVRGTGLDYLTSDPEPAELDKADPAYGRLVLDLSRGEPPARLRDRFDLVFSRMVNEHVADGERYYRNIHAILRPGGWTAHWFSTLYALPFLVNRLLPERLSGPLLDYFYPRDRHHQGKFAGRYRWSRGPSRQMQQRFARLGFEVVEYVGYFGHGYYGRRFPALQRLEWAKSEWLLRHPLPQLTAYARLVLRRSV